MPSWASHSPWASKGYAMPRTKISRAVLTSIPLMAGISSSAAALTFKGPHDLFPKQLQSAHKIMVQPFGAPALRVPSSLGLFQDGALDLEAAVAKTVRGSLHPMVEMRFKNTTDGLSLTAGTTSRDASFYVGGIPLCGFQVRAHALADRSVLLFGDIPDIDATLRFAPADWPDQELALEKTDAALADRPGSIKLISASRCLFVSNANLLPVWKLKVSKGALPYEVLADAYEVQKLEAGFFDAVDGTASVYARNSSDTAKTDYTLPGLTGDGSLTSAWLQTVFPGKTQKFTKISETSNTFNYDKTDARFMEVSTFAHAEMHRQFAASIGFEWYGPAPMQILMHIKPGGYLDKSSGEWIGGRSNNALFIPGSSDDNTLPQIQIDDGDGTDLQNLALDGDVVSHEFGHHIVYHTLRSTTGQSLALHEGLADFFVFARTGAPNLGETICPDDSGACILPGKALRSAALDLRYKDANWTAWAGASNKLGHLHGQLISGLLWDLRKDNEMSGDDVTRLTLKAVSLFRSDSGFRDFIVSLFMADKELFSGRDFAILSAHVQSRGLGEFLDGISTVDAELPVLQGAPASSSSAGSSGSAADTSKDKKQTKSSSNPLKCGVVPGADSSALALLGLLILATPFIASLIPKPVKVPARSGKKPDPKRDDGPA